ncbi:hypothetical protein [Agreia sp. COWG]|nr:hypothetical protein [Agreia sp. COWG]CAD5994072.1 protein of unknown function [Agreia sp. COWG]
MHGLAELVVAGHIVLSEAEPALVALLDPPLTTQPLADIAGH